MINILLLLVLFLLFLKFVLLPKLIPKIIEILPLEKDPQFHKLQLFFNQKGLDLWISFSILYSALVIPLVAKIDKIAIYDETTRELIGNAYLTENIVLEPFKDLKVSQLIKLEFESTSTLKRLVKCMSIGREKEFMRTCLRLEFVLTLTIAGLITIEGMPCSKIAHLGKVEEDKAKFRNRKLKEKQMLIGWTFALQRKFVNFIDYDFSQSQYQVLMETPYLKKDEEKKKSKPRFPEIPVIALTPHYLVQDLLPNPEVWLTVTPGLTTKSKTTISFSSPPALNMSLGLIELDLYLNQVLISHVICDPFEMNSTSNTASYSLTVIPRVVSNPIAGAITGGLSIMKGIFTGVGNGILFREWGAQSTIVGVRNIKFQDCDGSVGWVDEILDGFEIEESLDLKKGAEIVGNKRNDIAELIRNIWAAVLDKLKSS